MGLFGGSIQDERHSSSWPDSQLASLWWPEDRTWFVVSEIDYDGMIVAASRKCVDDLLHIRAIEAFHLSAGDTLAIS
jgi:hypothetical protein